MKIVTINHIVNYRIEVVYENGIVKIIDLENFLKSSNHPLIRKYLDVNLFSQVYLDKYGIPCWGDNEFDINPESILKDEYTVFYQTSTEVETRYKLNNLRAMEDIKKAQQRLVNAIVAMHPQLCMGDEKQDELYLAMHDLTSKMAKLNECGGECSNENSGLHLQRVMPMLLSIAKCFDDYLEDLDPKDDTEELSEAVEMMRNIVDDNSMFIRN